MRIVLFLTPTLNRFTQHVLEYIHREESLQIVGAVIDTTPELSMPAKLKQNIRRGRGGYVLIMAYHKFFGSQAHHIDTKAFMTEWQVPTLETDNPYTQDSQDQIRAFEADVGVLISAFGIVKSSLINMLEKGILSYHHGNMRHYRGQPPAFWELYHDELEMGVTVQRINRRLDWGEIIVEQTFAIDPLDTLESLEAKIFKNSESMMKTALLKVKECDFQGICLDQFGQVYTLPNLRQWLTFQIKMLKRKRYRIGMLRRRDDKMV